MDLLFESQITLILREGTDAEKRKAFEWIVTQNSEKLYWQIRHMVLDHDNANDILQNTFVKAWTNLESFMGYSKISTWLYRIAMNETLTFLAQERRRNSVMEQDPEQTVLKTLESDPYFDGNEAERLLQAAIATLPDKQRMVFNLKYFDELKYEEISQLTGTSVGALKASFHLAQKKIRDFFDNRH